ncbi:coiled-coil and C2 domain-containing protein 2A [Chelonus insularis]|uniref:coiled-coil and C2 domain-containing protein 2A n=1 Tax=Chelonus insularis TaxID=460826 RepID=UPI0015896962|nr:coiled-coil and C2 domain-containing protein 2A-like [Chelonus insularis]
MLSNGDFISGFSPKHEKKANRLSLYYCKPDFITSNVDSVLHNTHSCPRVIKDKTEIINDGLYVSAEGPLTTKVIKPYKLLTNYQPIITQSVPQPFKKLLDIAIREVKINGPQWIEITSIIILYKQKVMCKIYSPFNRKIYKLLITNNADNTNNFSIKISTRNGSCSILPLFIPVSYIDGKKSEIDFSISENGIVYSGTLFCTISVSIKGIDSPLKTSKSLYNLANDPNNPQNNLSLLKVKSSITSNPVQFFSLQDPFLVLYEDTPEIKSVKPRQVEAPSTVVLEQPTFTLKDITFGNLFEAKRPLKPSSGINVQQLQQEIGRDEVLSITILRGVQLPVREDSGTIHPFVLVTWGELSQATKPVEGATPVWHQTLHFEMPKDNKEIIKLSLFDQHPVWGYQWLGETWIPLEFHCNYQEFEKWVNLFPVTSPVVRFGYKNTSDISHTRIYIVIKLKKTLSTEESGEKNSIDVLAKTIQRCLITPYKLDGIDDPNDVGNLVMLLNPLPNRYGPLNPRQALKLNKIDYYGRAALLATLLRGLDKSLQVYVILGISQARKWAAFVMTINEQNKEINIWDPEYGEHYKLSDSRCSLIRVVRLINHQHIWKNLQNVSIPSNLKFNVKSSKDWQLMGVRATTTSINEAHLLKLESEYNSETDEIIRAEFEKKIKDKISKRRSKMGFITIFNPHAEEVLRKFLTQFSSRNEVQVDNSDFNKLYKSYYIYGFILSLRYTTKNELLNFFLSTKIHETTGPVEFALVSDIQNHVAKISSFWIAIAILRNRD